MAVGVPADVGLAQFKQAPASSSGPLVASVAVVVHGVQSLSAAAAVASRSMPDYDDHVDGDRGRGPVAL